ncbi:DGQHR domain-containing protein [Rhizobium leguminosarum]|nr:DGQHR domain-containing protein [Rhizobium leguminosarum]
MDMPEEYKFIEIHQHGRMFYLVNMPAEVVTKISYASVRGKDLERGAVQRVLNTRRITSIKDFALNGGNFPNSIVMNWVKDNLVVDIDEFVISFEIEENSAQLIDGQHRVAGLREAIAEDGKLAKYDLPVAIYVGLSTKECADIFLAINTEQKPVHRSLVFDLYEVADEQIVDPAAARARDIAVELNDLDSPFDSMIKFPGERPRKGGVALSTVVTAIKPLIELNGIFDQVGLSTLENQSRAISNFFKALQIFYGETWFDKQNAFMYAAGFSGAIDFLGKRMVPYCVQNKSFSTEIMQRAIELSESALIFQKDLSGKSGTEAQRYVFLRLDESFIGGESADEYEF